MPGAEGPFAFREAATEIRDVGADLIHGVIEADRIEPPCQFR